MNEQKLVDIDFWLSIFPNASKLYIQTAIDNKLLLSAGQITTPLRLVHFIAQCAHETGGFKYFKEIGNNDDYCGRGWIQLTGESNYKWIGNMRGKDYEGDPDMVQEPLEAFVSAILFWKGMSLNKLADADDCKGLTRKINGGYNGLKERLDYTNKLKVLLEI